MPTIMLHESLYVPNTKFLPGSMEQWMWLAYAAVSSIFWIFYGKAAKTDLEKRRIGWQMGAVGIAVWAYSEVMMIWFGQWERQSGIPLHLCYFLNFLLPLMVWNRSFQIFEWTYPIVMAGCLQALFTPDLKTAFPHFLNLKYWQVHIGLVQCSLYCIFVYGFRPGFSSIFKCLIFFNAYAAVACLANWLLGTNFMYLREKPPGTMLDLFGEWPWYIFGGELLAAVLFFLVWLPFGFLGFKDSLPASWFKSFGKFLQKLVEGLVRTFAQTG